MQITFGDVAPSEIPDIIDAFADVTVTYRGSTQGTYTVVTHWCDEVGGIPPTHSYGQNVTHLDGLLKRARSVRQ